MLRLETPAKIVKQSLAAALCVFGVAVMTARAELSVRAANKIITDAQSLQESGKFQQSVNEVKSKRTRCLENADPRSCQLRMLYTLAYLYEKEARRDMANREDHLNTAAEYCRAILSESPHHLSTVRKLVNIYNQVDQPKKAQALLDNELSYPRGQAIQNYRMLGELFEKKQEWGKAQAIYREGLAVHPESSTLRRKIIGTYQHQPLSSSDDIFSELKGWEAEHPSVVISGYERLLDNVMELDPYLAHQVLVHWVALIGQRRRVYGDVLRILPAAWDTPAVHDLRRYVANPGLVPTGESWWMGNKERREALSLFGSALGKRQQIQRANESAEKIWRTAAGFAPPYGQAILQNNTDLASLYLSSEQIDPEGRKLKSLVLKLHEDLSLLERAFRRKTLVNQSEFSDQYGDARQRYHTVLGYIYVKLKKWGSEETEESAIYHLTRVLRAAKERERITGYQPLAGIKRDLANAYRETGDLIKAKEFYLQSAEAYLDRDMLSPARRTVTRAKTLPVTDTKETVARTEALEKLLDVRKRYGRRNKINNDALSLVDRSVSLESYSALDPVFVKRQQFRVYADLASNQQISVKLRERVFSPKAWHYVGIDNELVGTGDLVRIRRLIQDRPRNIVVDPNVEKNAVRLSSHGAEKNGVYISIPERQTRKFVHLPGELMLTGVLYQSLNKHGISTESGYSLDVRQGRINIRSKELSEEVVQKAKEEAYKNRRYEKIEINRLPAPPTNIDIR